MESGGATGIPTWGKVWLSILGVYEWEGVNPMPPEIMSVLSRADLYHKVDTA